MTVRGVLLDFNGTLFNDTPFHIEAWRRFWKKKLGLDLSAQQVRTTCIGPGNADIFPRFLKEGTSPSEIARLGEEKEELYRSLIRSDPENMRLRPGAASFLDLLAERSVPFALATASPISNVEFYLNELGLSRWFTMDRVVYDDGKIAGKPDPAFYRESGKRIGIDPSECLIAEDSLAGIRAAIASGSKRVVVVRGTVPDELLSTIPGIFAVVSDLKGFGRFL